MRRWLCRGAARIDALPGADEPDEVAVLADPFAVSRTCDAPSTAAGSERWYGAGARQHETAIRAASDVGSQDARFRRKRSWRIASERRSSSPTSRIGSA
jgi:hypothetical protein